MLESKFVMKSFGLGYHKIDKCPKFCMFYYSENADFMKCRICGHTTYKSRTGRERIFVTHRKPRYFLITLWLQRLYIFSKTVEHMT